MPLLTATKTPPPGGRLTIELAGQAGIQPIAPPPTKEISNNTELMIAWIAFGSPGDKFKIEVTAPTGFKIVVANGKKNPVERKISPNLFVHTGSIKFRLEAAP